MVATKKNSTPRTKTPKIVRGTEAATDTAASDSHLWGHALAVRKLEAQGAIIQPIREASQRVVVRLRLSAGGLGAEVAVVPLATLRHRSGQPEREGEHDDADGANPGADGEAPAPGLRRLAQHVLAPDAGGRRWPCRRLSALDRVYARHGRNNAGRVRSSVCAGTGGAGGRVSREALPCAEGWLTWLADAVNTISFCLSVCLSVVLFFSLPRHSGGLCEGGVGIDGLGKIL